MKNGKKGSKKIIVQIPAYNEDKTISKVIAEIPRKIRDYKVEVLVIDDGSKDNTILEAEKAGADYIIKNKTNYGLAYSFQKGMNEALKLGADIIVNTDADFQYNQTEIPKLVSPIIEGRADIVSGNRQVEKLSHMSFAKKYGNILGSYFVQICSGNGVRDASSGFRAYSREAGLKLFVTSPHTYTHETIIQAKRKNLRIAEVPVEFRKREGTGSRLISSVPKHIKKSLATITRTTLMYNSLKAFSYLGALLMALGAVPFIRWVYLSYVKGYFGQHTQSLIIGLILIVFGGFSIMIGLISDILAINRRYLEDILERVKGMELKELDKYRKEEK